MAAEPIVRHGLLLEFGRLTAPGQLAGRYALDSGIGMDGDPVDGTHPLPCWV